LLAGFYLLRVHDTAVATYVAVVINFAVAVGALALVKSIPSLGKRREKIKAAIDPTRAPRRAYVVIALSGLSALGAEVVWTRLLSVMLGATVYTFSIILAVFLLGLGIGSTVGAYITRVTTRPPIMLGWCQMFLAVAIAWSACMITRSLPYWPINPAFSPSPWLTFQIDLFRCFLAVFPAACLWGASFPLALASVFPGQDSSLVVGRIYAANTAGAIIGVIGFTLAVIPTVGTQQAQRLLIALAVIGGLIMLARDVRKAAQVALLTGATVCAAWLLTAVAAIPPGIVGYGRSMMTYNTMPNFLYVGEGMTSSVAVSELESGVRNFHVSGKIEASSEQLDMRLQLMLGNIPAMIHDNPRSVLVVGFGAGVTAGSFIPYPGIERIVICEIEPIVPQIASRYFTDQNQGVLNDPRVEVIYDDARHYILTTDETFDIITSDPIHPWVKGAATLYTREYFDLVKHRLNPGGVVTQWVPLYESSSEVVKSEIATFFDAFPGGAIFGNAEESEGYDVVLVGQVQSAQFDVEQMERRLGQPEYGTVLRVLNAVGFVSASDLMDTYAASHKELIPWLAGAEINRDRSLRLQYLAGLGLNLSHSAAIYNDILSYRRRLN
jgi:spermidine synthase